MKNISEVALSGTLMNDFDGIVTEYDQVQSPMVILRRDPRRCYDSCPRAR
jgi:hypothetical protein